MPELRSWITTLCGFGAVLSAAGAWLMSLESNPELDALINALEFVTAGFAGGVGYFARDSRRSSQDVGVRGKTLQDQVKPPKQ